jgi:hypothetical protein
MIIMEELSNKYLKKNMLFYRIPYFIFTLTYSRTTIYRNTYLSFDRYEVI